VNDYEILLMLDPETPEERHDEIIARTRELIEKGGGKWLSHDSWGRRRLAYEIDHKPDGVYHLLQFDAEPATLNEVARVLRISDGVMRHMATRRPKGGTRAAPPPLPTVETERAPAPYEPGPEPETGPPAAAEPVEAEAEADDSDKADAVGVVDEAAPAEEYAGPTESETGTESEGGT
jgi:small subunit ribosomal protein S6